MTLPTGAWRRDWIHRRGGARDASVAVRYVQTPSVFADLRTPELAIGAASFAELDDDQLAALARQDGFAGVATIDGDRVTWHHEIDFQPASAEVDVGRIEPIAADDMFEHALDGAYVERWSRLAPDTGPYVAARAVHAGTTTAILAVAGAHFVYARARPTPLPAAASLGALIAHAPRAQVLAYLDCEISYGATPGWRIERSTLPWRVGARAAVDDVAWQVVERTCTPAELAAMLGPRHDG
ncbi:MAG TPA: hypothetical protein VFP84_23385 [Kofleriaceae bacterium]|nr:hypothetical protein [Kofleriaceae bacterium]